MLLHSFTKEELDNFTNCERPGVRIAKDFYALANENCTSVDAEKRGDISIKEIAEASGNKRLKKFLDQNGERLSALSFSAKNLQEVIMDSVAEMTGLRRDISLADLTTFSWLSAEFNRRCYYEGNFQSFRESVGMHGAGLAFLFGVILGWTIFTALVTKAHLFLPPAEGIVLGIVATVGIPLCLSIAGYFFGTSQADKYFKIRIEKIDQILDRLERCTVRVTHHQYWDERN
jgi:hypothetical protein